MSPRKAKQERPDLHLYPPQVTATLTRFNKRPQPSRVPVFYIPPCPPTTMPAETRSTLATFAPSVPVSFLLRVFSALRSLVWVTLIIDNPLTWWWLQGRRNERADMEGTCVFIVC